MESAIKNGKVLIVDDEIDLCHLLKGYFLRKNFEVYLAHTLEQGMSFVGKLQPDIIFIDNNLPDGIGWQMAPDLATNYPQLQINLISAFHPLPPEMPIDAKFRIIEKPISLADLDKAFTTDNIAKTT